MGITRQIFAAMLLGVVCFENVEAEQERGRLDLHRSRLEDARQHDDDGR